MGIKEIENYLKIKDIKKYDFLYDELEINKNDANDSKKTKIKEYTFFDDGVMDF